jgi:ABC-type transport system involved in Fe-S cluster assembly fused permease/ATPase subunit
MLAAAASVLRGGMTLGDFVMVNTYFLQLYQVWSQCCRRPVSARVSD